MKIGFYVAGIPRSSSGIQIYATNLMNSILTQHRNIELSLIYNISKNAVKASSYGGLRADVKKICYPIPEKYALKLWDSINFPQLDIAGINFDIIHCATSFVPPIKKTKTIVTVHDLVCMKHPELLIISKDRVKIIIKTIQNADLILTISKNTQKDIIELLDIDKKKIVVIHLGIDPIFETKIDQQSIKKTLERYRITFPYYLYVGNIDPRKNLRRLITAYGKFVKKKRDKGKLLLIGYRTSRGAEELSIIDDLNLQERVIYLGYVPRADLPLLYAGAKIFIFPSIYEGFGFPVLEAMSCGVPVITSNTSSLPEIAGDSAYFVVPDSVDSIVEALDAVDSNEDLRLEMINKGLKRAKLFQWQYTASKTVDCYRRLINL